MENTYPKNSEKKRPSLRSGKIGAAAWVAYKASRTPLGDPNSHLIKWSTRRLVVSGNIYELYTYERPYFYNWGPQKRAGGDGEYRPQDRKRDDHILRARRQIRRLVNANVATQIPKFVTYTFAQNVKTLREANPLFTEFQKELQRRFGRTRYLCVPEFQERGAVHFHVIYFDLPYIKNIKNVLAKLWKHGFVKVIAVREIRNIGAYVSKYLQKGLGDKRSCGHKGYFCSRLMIQPEEFRAEVGIDKKILGDTFESEAVESFDSRHGLVTYQRMKRIC